MPNVRRAAKGEGEAPWGWGRDEAVPTPRALPQFVCPVGVSPPHRGNFRFTTRTTAVSTRRCSSENAVRPSGSAARVDSVGDCYDNAMAESFFATVECELLAQQPFLTQLEARTALFEYIEVFYNRQRRHSALGYVSPDAYERRWATHTPVVA